jgi:CRISPR/Cas system-associated exonuclease Cas4 (RecB family)
MPGEVLSPSQASTFLGCSAKYRFKYVLDLPDPAAGGAVRGRAVHKAIEYYMRAKINGLTLDGEAITDEWDEIWDGACEGAEFAAKEDVEALKAAARSSPANTCAKRRLWFSRSLSKFRCAARFQVSKSAESSIILDAEGRIIDIKTASRKPSKISGDHAFQLATYATLLADSVSGNTRIDSLIATKDPQLIQIEHTPGASGRKLVERMYPLVAEGIANGLFIPNRASTLCGYCPYARECETEYGGAID